VKGAASSRASRTASSRRSGSGGTAALAIADQHGNSAGQPELAPDEWRPLKGLMRIPKTLAEEWRREPGWLAQLSGLTAECAAMWDLELEEPIDTPHSLVVPAGDAVLTLNVPSHFEADHEAEALARWAGAGAVRLLARDDQRRALVIERCRPGTQLWDADVDQPAVVSELLPQLWQQPKAHPFRLLADEAEGWAEEVPRRWKDGGRPFERSLLAFAVDVYRSADRKATFLANQDLHGGNILRAERKPWLVIDPQATCRRARAGRRWPVAECCFAGHVVGDLCSAIARLPRGAGSRPRPAAGMGCRSRARLGLGRRGPMVAKVSRGCAHHPHRLNGPTLGPRCHSSAC
jgi:streptomycin 6-kinase